LNRDFSVARTYNRKHGLLLTRLQDERSEEDQEIAALVTETAVYSFYFHFCNQLLGASVFG